MASPPHVGGRSHASVVELGQLAEVDVGIVTGANAFFVMRQSEAIERRLDRWTIRMASRSAHLRGAVLRDEDWLALDADDERVRLLDLRPDARGGIARRPEEVVPRGGMPVDEQEPERSGPD